MAFTKPTLATTLDWPQQNGRLIDIVEGPAFRNFLRNGDFAIAQRGTSFAGITTAQYTLDGWVAGSAGTQTVTQQSFTVGQTDVPGNPKKFIRVDRTVATGTANSVLEQRIEDPERLSGKTVTVSFWAKVASGTKALGIDLYSGAGGLVTPAIDTDETGIPVTTTWTLFKATIAIPTITAVSAGAYLAARIVELASFSTFTLDVADFQVEFGNEATLFERLNFHQQLSWCQRFFCKSFPIATAPAQNSGIYEGAINIPILGAAVLCGANIVLPQTMRVAPTITLYNPAAANGQIRNTTDAADFSGSATSAASERHAFVYGTSNAGGAVGEFGAVHWSATAEV